MKKKTFSKFKKNKNNELEVDITSLLDILVILLVFLLKSYNASDLKLEVAKDISLPKSTSSQLGNNAIIVQVGAQRDLWIDNRKVGKIEKNSPENIPVLFNELKSRKEKIEKEITNLREIASTVDQKNLVKNKETMNKRVNIVLDQSLPYDVLRKVMNTAATAGYPEFKFIVTGNY